MIRIGNAPCSWGVLEFGLEGETADYRRVLNEMQETGYEGTELGDWGFLPTDPHRLREELRARGLSLLGGFVPVALKDPQAHAAGQEAAVRTAHLLAGVQAELGGIPNGAPYIVLADDNGKDPVRAQNAGRIRPEHGLSAAEWQTFALGAQRIAEAVRQATGLRTVFHHHCGGYVETPAEVDRLMGLTDPLLLGLCFDTGHYSYGGGDALAGLRQHASRIWHVHFKDYDPAVGAYVRTRHNSARHSSAETSSAAEGWGYLDAVRQGVFCPLGQGAVDWAGVVAELRAMRYEGWIVVEQDVLPGQGEPKGSARRNRAFIGELGL
jgi:inosose dehydratase